MEDRFRRLNPFRYPRQRHERSLQPPPTLSRNQHFKPWLQKEFKGKCVYCLMPDTLKDQGFFGVDHYLPKVSYPHLEREYDNLFYACNACNSAKGDRLPAGACFIPNPCDHRMADHLHYEKGSVRSKTSTGEWTIGVLRLNRDKEILRRTVLLKFLHTVLTEESELEEEIRRIQELQLDASRSGPELAALDNDLRRASIELRKAREDIASAVGSGEAA